MEGDHTLKWWRRNNPTQFAFECPVCYLDYLARVMDK
jgi:hypothetical protein